MGTTFLVKITPGPDGLEQDTVTTIAQGIESTLADINGKMSTYDPSSELSRFNESESLDPFTVSAETFQVISAAQAISRETDGAFDITVGPLVNAWGFGPDERTLEGPDAAGLNTLLESVGFEKLSLQPEGPHIVKSAPRLRADLSAIAKGYAVDRVAAYVHDQGFADFMVEIGGEVRAAGLNASGVPWRIAIKQPTEEGGAPADIIELADRAMATSGDYENYYEVDGVRLSHTIDPATGRPITHRLASVTVLHEECMYADAYATAIDVMGPERGMAFAEAKGLAVMMIVRGDDGGFEISVSPKWTD